MFMPSVFEPCGLVQFEGWLFGSLTIGSRVGGIADTVIPLSPTSLGRGNGFLFDRDKTGETSLSAVIPHAFQMWKNLSSEEKRKILVRCMTDAQKSSWTEAPHGYSPVEQYRLVYENAKRNVALRAEASGKAKKMQIDLLKLFRRIGTQQPSQIGLVQEDRYLRLRRNPQTKFAHLEQAYFSVPQGQRGGLPTPYTRDVNFREHDRYGAQPFEDHTHFELFAPHAHTVLVKNLDRNEIYPMTKQKDGSWTLDVQTCPVGTRYQYVVNDQIKIDPYGRQTQPTESGKPCSVVHNPQAYQWSDHSWLTQRTQKAGRSEPTTIFELYPAAWRKNDGKTLTYRELAPELVSHCQQNGYTHVELMGLLDHPLESSWGYQVSSYFAPNSRMGSPDDLKYLIDYLHRNNIGVVMDFIPNHFAVDDYALNKFDGTDQFQPSKLALLFSIRNLFLAFGSKLFDFSKKPVRDFLVSSAHFWIDEMHVDMMRFDAIRGILNSEDVKGAKLFLKQLNASIHANFPGVITVAEDYSGSLEVTSPFHQHGLGFDMKWNIGWMKHSLDFFHKKPADRRYCYQRIIKAIEANLESKNVMAISHDEVKEDRPLLRMTPGLSQEEEFANLRSFFGLMYTMPGKKLLFMGCDTASEEAWETLIGKTRGVDDKKLDDSRKRVSAALKDLSALYRDNPAFYEKDANAHDLQWIEKNHKDGRVVAFRRINAEQTQSCACFHNFTDVGVKEFPVKFRAPIPAGQEVPLLELFNSDDGKYGGKGLTNPHIEIVRNEKGEATGYKVQVPPLSSVVIQEPALTKADAKALEEAEKKKKASKAGLFSR